MHVLPKIVSEGTVIGQHWGESLAPEIEKARRNGVEKRRPVNRFSSRQACNA